MEKKTYKKVKLIAKNLPTGSYAAGCPQNRRGSDPSNRGLFLCQDTPDGCAHCDRVQ